MEQQVQSIFEVREHVFVLRKFAGRPDPKGPEICQENILFATASEVFIICVIKIAFLMQIAIFRPIEKRISQSLDSFQMVCGQVCKLYMCSS